MDLWVLTSSNTLASSIFHAIQCSKVSIGASQDGCFMGLVSKLDIDVDVGISAILEYERFPRGLYLKAVYLIFYDSI